MLKAAREKNNNRLYYVMLTLCATGIRVSELKFITLEAVKNGKAEINLKGKIRTIVLHKELIRKLKKYADEQWDKQQVTFSGQAQASHWSKQYLPRYEKAMQNGESKSKESFSA